MSPRRAGVVGVVAVATITLIRAAILFQPGDPSGIDGGNWLAFGSFDRPGMAYPPLVPALFTAIVQLFGAPVATALIGTLATGVLALVVLAILNWAGHPRAAAFAAIGVAASGPVGELAAWGGYPQAIATAMAMVALVALTRWLLEGGGPAFAVFAISFAAVVASSHLVAAPALVAVAGLLTAAAARSQRRAIRRHVAAVLATVLPFAVLWPTYANLLATLGGSGSERADDANRILGFVWPIYPAVLVLITIGLVVRQRDPRLGAGLTSRDVAVLGAVSAAGAGWLLGYLLTGEPRLLYDISVLAVLGGAAGLAVLRTSKAAPRVHLLARAVAIAAVIAISATGLASFPAQVSFYRVLTIDRFQAINWLAGQASASPSGEIVVADVVGVPIGWWVEGIVRHEVLFASDLRWLRFPSERDRAIAANAFLYASPFPAPASVALAVEQGVQLVFLPAAGRYGIDPDRPPAGWRIMYRSGEALILAPAPEQLRRTDG